MQPWNNQNTNRTLLSWFECYTEAAFNSQIKKLAAGVCVSPHQIVQMLAVGVWAGPPESTPPASLVGLHVPSKWPIRPCLSVADFYIPIPAMPNYLWLRWLKNINSIFFVVDWWWPWSETTPTSNFSMMCRRECERATDLITWMPQIFYMGTRTITSSKAS